MYKAKVSWYNDYEDKDEVSFILVCAESWEAAMKYIVEGFDYIDSIEIEQLHAGEHRIVYIPPECVVDVTRENNW